MAETKLRELLRKYLEGKATSEEQRLVDDWYEMLPDGKETHLSDAERVDLRDHYWNSLNRSVRRFSRGRQVLWTSLAIAASVSAILLIATFLVRRPPPLESVQMSEASVNDEWIENKTDAIREVRLADSSVVRLSPGSSMRVPVAFNVKDRVVELSGEAFFDIYRMEYRPFVVYANEVTTRVLGTSFTVRAYPGDPEITVAVKSGSVSVYANGTPGRKETDNIVLIPNQQAVYQRDEGTVSRMLVSEPEVVISEEEVKKIRFEGVSAAEIFKALEKMYGVDIEFIEEDFLKCTMTTSAGAKDLYERIGVICEITGARYTVEDTRIRITGSGCN